MSMELQRRTEIMEEAERARSDVYMVLRHILAGAAVVVVSALLLLSHLPHAHLCMYGVQTWARRLCGR